MTNGGLLQQEEKEFRSFYKRSMWWVEHRDQLKKIGIGILIAFDAVLILFALWVYVDVFLLTSGKIERATAEMVVYNQADLRAFSVEHAADDLITKEVDVFPLGDNRYDLYTTLANPNDDWYATFRYAFVIGSTETDEQTGFILPSEEKPIVYLAYEAESRPTNARLALREIQWKRVDPHVISDYERWRNDRLGFEITNPAFSTELQIDAKEIGRATFEVKNATAFSYWEPAFYVLLMRGSAVAGVTRTTIDRFESGDAREVSVSWFGTLPAVSRVEIVPEINLFDPDVYMPLSGE
jgi:hypothetical protein